MQFVYPANLSRTALGEVVVNFRDLPECLTSGSDTSDALTAAADALAEALAGRIDDGDPIPPPSPTRPGERGVPVPPGMAAKAALAISFRESGLTRVAFAASLGIDEKAVRRMLSANQPAVDVRSATTVRCPCANSRFPTVYGVVDEVGVVVLSSAESFGFEGTFDRPSLVRRQLARPEPAEKLDAKAASLGREAIWQLFRVLKPEHGKLLVQVSDQLRAGVGRQRDAEFADEVVELVGRVVSDGET